MKYKKLFKCRVEIQSNFQTEKQVYTHTYKNKKFYLGSGSALFLGWNSKFWSRNLGLGFKVKGGIVNFEVGVYFWV